MTALTKSLVKIWSLLVDVKGLYERAALQQSGVRVWRL